MFPPPLSRVISAFKRLPGIGPKSAERLAFFLLKQKKEEVLELSSAICELKASVLTCEQCSNVSEKPLCHICSNLSRDAHQICIVEEATDIAALEHAGIYKGLYHVLQGALSPLDGIGPEHLTVGKLSKRLEKEKISEIIFALNPTVTGEATALYLEGVLKPRSIKMTHLAQGIPMGGHLEFADPDTLKRAYLGRS